MRRPSPRPLRRARAALVPLLVLLVTACTPEQWIEHWFRAYGATDAQVADAQAIARCESDMNPAAVGGSNRGLMQINVSPRAQLPRIRALGYTAEQMLDPGPNAHVAADLWAARGRRFSGSSGWPVCARITGVR